ncbi:hypothetical protein DBR32_12310 [Taibaiella sp. KBW10]|uniref:hypothetical protein n=1 Tax=Taibaiella sp. KBW10 TaxID=2153357 RepID=UPI000F5987A2|nr:hypothetical protein [Taibaiella sp. KBW10]RQO30347.1 hypothetical protein DBR32_12310 [Taibaiella sp. KBW10]
MKKVILIAVLALFGATASFAQSNILNTVANAAGAVKTVQKIGNVASAAKEISSTLTNTLGLSKLQNSKLVNIFTKHITGTNAISSLANSNITTYAAKLLGLNTGTLGSLKTLLTVSQYAKLLGLGGSSSGGGSLLNALSGGNNLSTGAASVLGSLLMK